MTKFLNISTDTTLGGGSPADDVVVSQKAIKTYVDNNSGGGAAPTAIDAEIYGTLTVSSDGDVSGLSVSDYMLFPGAIDMTSASTFEMVFAFTTATYTTGGSIIMPPSHLEHPVEIKISSSKIVAQVYSNTSTFSMTGTTTLQSNTKYYVKLSYAGSDYTLYLSTDGSSWTTEATHAATYLIGTIPGPYQLGRKSSTWTGVNIMHMSECYIKRDGILIWRGIDCPGLHQRVPIGHEVIEFQAPTLANNYTWYRKYADGWVEMGGRATQAQTAQQSVTLPVTMADSNYQVLSNVVDDNLTGYTFCVQVKDKSTTGFKTQVYASYQGGFAVSGYSFDWEVKGMAA